MNKTEWAIGLLRQAALCLHDKKYEKAADNAEVEILALQNR